jgi:hemoglobin
MKKMFNQIKTPAHGVILAILIGALIAASGCHTKTPAKQNKEFFTSGSREADQRASQRMAKEEQLSGSGEGAGEKHVKKAEKKETASGGSTNKAAQAEGKLALYDRLGGEKGLTAIVEDATPRILQDPRVNFQRNGVKQGGFSLTRDRSVTWKGTPEQVALFKKHLVEFLALASGGPAHYEGRDMKSVHAGMHISNPEFDAAIGDLKASLDKLQIPNTEQKELLAIVESTRPEIVTVR